MNAVYQRAVEWGNYVYQWFYPPSNLGIQDLSLEGQVGSLSREVEALCKSRMNGGYYGNGALLEASMKLRKKGSDLLLQLEREGKEEKWIFEVDSASHRLIQFEQMLVESSLALGTGIHFEGVAIQPMEPLIDVKDRVLRKLEELISQFEAVSYLSAYLFSHPIKRYPVAYFKEEAFQPTNYSEDSLAVSMRNRRYGYELLLISLRFDRVDLIVRLESAIQNLVKLEDPLNRTYQKLYETGPIKPAEDYEIQDREYKKMGAKFKEQGFKREELRVYAQRKIDPLAIQKFLKAYDLTCRFSSC